MSRFKIGDEVDEIVDGFTPQGAYEVLSIDSGTVCIRHKVTRGIKYLPEEKLSGFQRRVDKIDWP